MTLTDKISSANEMKNQLRAASNVTVSDETIRYQHHEVNLHTRHTALRLRPTEVHRNALLAGSQLHLAWARQKCSRQLFEGEVRFTLLFITGRIHVWTAPRALS